MTNEEGHLKNGDDEWKANGDAGGENDQPPKESDPLQPKMVKSKSLKEVKEVLKRYSIEVFLLTFTLYDLENIDRFYNTGTKT